MWNPDPLPPTLEIRPWVDARMDALGHDPRSEYVEEYWLGVLGPTATWLMRRLADRLESSPQGFELDLATVAVELGVGSQSGLNSPCVRSLRRCARFGLVQLRDPATVLVRRKLPSLSYKQVERLPDHLRARHATAAADAFFEAQERARGLALAASDRGLARTEIERELHRHGVHPALAHTVAAWVEERTADASPAQQAAGGSLPPAA